MAHARVRAPWLPLPVLTAASCDDPASSTSIARLGTAPSAAVDVGDTWAGSAIDSAGRIADLPDCSLEVTGAITDIQADSMAGTYTGSHSCIGAVEGGRLLLVRQ